MTRRQPLNSHGAALITALFITAICAIIATALAVRGSVIIHEGELVKSADQAYLNLQSVQYWARSQIKTYVSQWVGLQGQAPATLRPMEWQFRRVKLGDKFISAEILDAQGRYNVNNLLYSANQPPFAALVMAVEPTVSQKTATRLAQAVTDWMTKGQLDAIYLKENPPYRAPRRQMADETELRLVDGMSPELYQKLSPYVIALPMATSAQTSTDTKTSTDPGQSAQQSTSININGALWPVLMAASPGLTRAQAQALVACRKRFAYFTSVDAFNNDCEKPLHIQAMSNLTTQSQYYLLNSVASGENVTLHFNSLLMSQVEKDNKINVKVIWQAFY